MSSNSHTIYSIGGKFRTTDSWSSDISHAKRFTVQGAKASIAECYTSGEIMPDDKITIRKGRDVYCVQMDQSPGLEVLDG